MGAPGDEFQDLNADHQQLDTPRKRGKLAMQNGVAPFCGEIFAAAFQSSRWKTCDRFDVT
jgi:hypothetical protein